MTELLLLLTFSFEYKNLGCSYSENHSPVGTPANRTYVRRSHDVQDLL